jgi:peptide/nickel transport system substrate-binding protein/oligopeptide transport system substrate-binding protein
MRGLRGVFVVFGLVCALSLAGCGLPWPFPQPTPDPKLPDAQQVFRPLDSGTNAGDMDSLDPGQLQFQFDSGMAQLIFPQLVTLDEQQPVDWAAESHEISADGLTYTFHLHKGMTWADGTPIDATTFAYSINRTLDPCTPTGVSFYLFDLAGAEAFHSGKCPPGAIKSTAALIGSSIQTPDPLTLRLTLAHPAGYFLSKLTWPTSFAVPQALVEKYTQPGQPGDFVSSTWTKHLLDDGRFGGNLYLLTKWQLTQPTDRGSLIFERNERFWGKKPLLRRIEYTLYKDVAVEWSDFTVGKGDISGFPQAQLAMARTLKGVSIQQLPALAYSFVTLNTQVAPFDDARMRQAFSLALDRNALIAEASRQFAQPTFHLIPEGAPGYNPDLADTAGRKGRAALTPDLDAARALATSYAAEHCGGAYSKCPPIAILRYERGSSTYTTLMQPMMDQWHQMFPGWVIQFAWVPPVQIPTIPPYQLMIGAWGADYPDPQDLISQRWTTHAAYNSDHISIPQVDSLLAQADTMSDQAARLALYRQAEQLLIKQAPIFPLWQSLLTYAMRSRVANWRIAPTQMTPLSVWQSAYIKR